jgi:hypothetical protein
LRHWPWERLPNRQLEQKKALVQDLQGWLQGKQVRVVWSLYSVAEQLEQVLLVGFRKVPAAQLVQVVTLPSHSSQGAVQGWQIVPISAYLPGQVRKQVEFSSAPCSQAVHLKDA